MGLVFEESKQYLGISPLDCIMGMFLLEENLYNEDFHSVNGLTQFISTLR